MPAPTGSDGIARAVTEMAAPSVGVFITVFFTKAFLGGIAAGLVYLGLLSVILIGLVTSAKYWNFRYFIHFLPAAILLFLMVPNIISTVVGPVFRVLSSLLTLVGLAVLAVILFKKSPLSGIGGGR